MINYGRQDINQDDIDAVLEVLRSDFLTQGPLVPRFEQAVAEKTGAAYGVAVNSGTSALHIACQALGVRSGDRVWTTAITFVASANCALYCDADVDFVDIDPDTYNLSVACLAEKLVEAEKVGRLPKVVIPVHLCGQPCDMAAIKVLGDKYGFHIIEDASHALGATYKRQPVGDCRYSDITVFSFHPVKIITTAEGGLAVTNSVELCERMQQFRSHGITGNKALMEARPEEEIWNYQQVTLGSNYRMTDIQAALGLSQLHRLDEFIAGRRNIAGLYDEAFRSLPVKLPFQHPDGLSSYHLYPIRVNRDTCGLSQKEVYQALHAIGILVNLHYIPVYRHPYYEAMGFRAGYCREAEQYFRESLSLPIYPAMSEAQKSEVISKISEVIAG